jgi:cytochrome c biogenesis protein CcmG, thiol:disulfide interchange protein DsbE
MLRRPILLLPLFGFLLLAVAFAVYLEQNVTGQRSSRVLPSALIDRPAPHLDLPPLAGIDRPGLDSGLLHDRVVLVNFFASWCVPCRAEHATLMRLAKQGVTIYGVAYKDKPEDSRAWLAELGNPFARIGTDLDGRTAIDWGVYGVPETYVIGKDGRVRYKQVGPLMDAQWDRTVAPIVRKLAR